MTLHVHRSHRMERLAERFVELVDGHAADVFETPLVVVQGVGMERWLAQHGARRHGIFAGVEVVRVRALVKLVCDAALGGAGALASETELEPATLPYRILSVLDDVLATPDGAPFRAYLATCDDPERRAQLAERLGEALDRYGVHRPAMLEEWIAGRIEDDPLVRAQAAIFRRIVANAPSYEAKRVRAAVDRLDPSSPLLARALPRRIHVFGVATLAPLYLELVRRVADVTDVHLYVLCPGTEWLSDLSHEESAFGEIGSLIRGFGKLAADFQSLLEDAGESTTEYVEDDEPEPSTVLEVLQHDLRTLTQRGDVAKGRAPRVAVASDDRSFVVHACHSQRRELEVLREVILDALERDPTLAPHDVAVLAPDIEAYAPLVHAVFHRDEGEAGRLPFHVADRGARAGSAAIDSFFALLEAFRARFTLPVFADLLARPPIAARQGLEAEDVELALSWLRDAGARWGLDRQDRAAEGQPDLVPHTFERALDRLALGFATGTEDARLADVHAHPIPGGKGGYALAGLLTFFDAFVRLRSLALAARTVAEHVAATRAVLDALVDDSDGGDEDALRIRAAIREVEARANDAEFSGEFSSEAFLRAVTNELDAGEGSGGFLRGGITFCRQIPMRAIPFRVLCLLGLDDDSYPRDVDPPRFDLVARKPQRGDRTPRDDDRQSFLDALLSARDALHIFHVGRDVADDREKPVSTVVSRTLEVIERAVVRADGGAVRDVVWVSHPLHPFDPAHFVSGSEALGLVSRSTEMFEAAKATLAPPSVRDAELALAIAGDGRSPTESVPEVTLAELLAFLRDPEEDFVRNVLGAETDVATLDLPDREALEATGLDGYALRALALEHFASGGDETSLAEVATGRGLLPPGALGEEAISEVAAFAEAALALAGDATPHAPFPFELPLKSAKLVGTFTDLRTDGAVEVTAATLKDGRRFAAFVRHLVLTAVPGLPVPVRTRVVARAPSPGEPAVEYAPSVPADLDVHAALDTLVRAYLAGRTEPTVVDVALLDAAAKNGSEDGDGRDAALAALLDSLRSDGDRNPWASGPSAARRTLFRDAFAPGAELGVEVLGAEFDDVLDGVYRAFRAGSEKGR